MGNALTASPTPENVVGQGGASTPQNRCLTTPPPKGVGVGVGQPHLCSGGVGQISPFALSQASGGAAT